MTTIECPWCDGPAHVDAAMTAVACDGCGIHADLSDDPEPAALEAAA